MCGETRRVGGDIVATNQTRRIKKKKIAVRSRLIDNAPLATRKYQDIVSRDDVFRGILYAGRFKNTADPGD